MLSQKPISIYPRFSVIAAFVVGLLSLVTLLASGVASADSRARSVVRPTIVLVHGDWADAASWSRVIPRLQSKGYTVVAPPNLLRGPDTDAPYLAGFLKSIQGPIVLVAHSYGGFVATNAATGNDNVKALVYIDAFAPDEGETAGELVARGHSCVNNDALNLVPYDGGVDLYLRWDAYQSYPGFMKCFANGVDRQDAAALAAMQRPAAPAQFSEPSGPPAWKTIPSWSLIGTEDHVIPLPLQEEMSSRAGAHITRIKAGHLSLLTHPGAVTNVILAAVDATSTS
jgi:pimeloyl-ACP methyl ester carboxylesterase